MSSRPNRKIVLAIVEGQSEINAFQTALNKLYERVDPEIEVFFTRLVDLGNEKGGDVTSKQGVHPDNIEAVINKIIINPIMTVNRFMKKDVIEVIQFTDLDGCYIGDDMLEEDATCTNLRYHDGFIMTNDIEKTIERNERKRSNLDYLSSIKHIKVQTKSVPYYIYYFSTNLDHFICGKQNLEGYEKIIESNQFGIDNGELENFENYIRSNEYITKEMSYEASWNYIKEGNNSLNRKSNINLLLDRFIAITE